MTLLSTSTITSSSSLVEGTDSGEHLNGGSGADAIDGNAGNDRINAGSGSDTADGGAGSDIVKLDSGNDTAIYVAADNIGFIDVYDGGSGYDTIRLVLTRAEWLNSTLQQDLARYRSFLAEQTNPVNGQATNAEFRFTAFDLRVSKFETLEIRVDGAALDPRDQAVILAGDAATTSEDAASPAINLLANDSVPDLVADVVIVSGPTKGAFALDLDLSDVTAPKALFVYTPGPALQSLALGETATDTVTYKVIDADGDEQTATVTITITGGNDGPKITGGLDTAQFTEALNPGDGLTPPLSASGHLSFTDLDLTDSHTLDVSSFTAVWSEGDGIPAATLAALENAVQVSYLPQNSTPPYHAGDHLRPRADAARCHPGRR
jgi:hypothetical protein